MIPFIQLSDMKDMNTTYQGPLGHTNQRVDLGADALRSTQQVW